jgi:hypothetical protein
MAPNLAVRMMRMMRMFNEVLNSHDFTGSGTKHKFILQNTSLHGSIIFIAVHHQLSADRLLFLHSACLGISLPYKECWHIKGGNQPSIPFNQPRQFIITYLHYYFRGDH